MTDHPWVQGNVWRMTPQGDEPVCAICNSPAAAHGAAPAFFGRLPPAEPDEIVLEEPEVEHRSWWWHFRHPQPGPADHVRFGPVLYIRKPRIIRTGMGRNKGMR